jgi:hypothetical protein
VPRLAITSERGKLDAKQAEIFQLIIITQKAVTVLRRARVPEDQVSELLGHKRPNLRTTAGYGDWDPDYQREAAAALDAWFGVSESWPKPLS